MAILVKPYAPIPNKILLISFGYIHGMLTADYVFNVAKIIPSNIIPNVTLSGLNPINKNFIARNYKTQISTIENCIKDIVGILDEGELTRGIIIGIGCTYGQHRSVSVVEIIGASMGRLVAIKHRDVR